MRLDKYLSDCKVDSRRNIKKILKNGLVTVNSKIETNPAYIVDEMNDEIKYADKIIKYEKFIYLMMNKPSGYISATDDSRHKTVSDLIPDEFKAYNLFPAGRLDIDTEGFLLLTNDGAFAHNILSPKKHVSKTYYAIVKGKITPDKKDIFKDGVTLNNGYHTLGADLKILCSNDDNSEIEITLYEGKFHQVKKMFEAIGSKVIYLKRISMGNLMLDLSLKAGDVKKMTKDEITLIKD